MNDEAQVQLNRILSLDPNDVSESDMAFLKARSSYLTEEQLIKFGIGELQSKEPRQETARKRSKK